MRKPSYLILLFTILNLSVLPSIVYCQAKDVVRVIKSAGGTVKISLPEDWERIGGEEANTFAKKDLIKPKYFSGLFDMLISDVGYNPAYNTKSFQALFLDKIKNEALKDTEAGWQIDEYAEILEVPALIMNRERNGKKVRDIHFLKDCKYYLITFGYDKDYFDEQWKDFESRIKNIEIVK